MNQNELVDFFLKADKDGLEIMKKKNTDYANPDLDVFKNFRVSSVVGVNPAQAILVRIMDKICRISNIIKSEGKQSVSDEGIRDTIIDARTYLAILGAFLEKELIPEWKAKHDDKIIYKN